MESIKQKFNEWATERFPASTPKRVFKVLLLMIAAVIAILGYSFYDLSASMGAKNALVLMATVAGIIYVMYHAQFQSQKK